ncbi:MAG: hypothetical protein K2J77_04690 [Oscillospiraceae bacterium]|nr:hypothetical protein [Oscillospiraceae bacterium]
MSFGNIKKWELITLGAAAAAAIVLRVLEENGVLSVPRVPAIIVLMAFVGVFFLRRPAALAFEFIKTKQLDKDKRATIVIDAAFALIAEGVLVWLLLNSR